ncbi:hypothetical protein Q9233_007495 [Columba guinea]|nr:hypothetical protein Q9233_007495 [Columba guinea]
MCDHKDGEKLMPATSGGGGWPMSVWLTPDLKPFAGGTYFPPEDGVHRVGFRTVLLRIAEQWKENKDSLLESSRKILEALQHVSEIRVRGQESPPPSKEVMATCFQQLSNSYDEDYGGFSKSPKFPSPGQSCLAVEPLHGAGSTGGAEHTPELSHRITEC